MIKQVSELRDAVANEKVDFVENWLQPTRNAVDQWFRQTQEAYKDEIQKRTSDLDQHLDRSGARFDTQLEGWEAKVNALENAYNEKLSLEGPVRYWNSLDRAYTRTGTRWTWVAIVASLVFVVLILDILYWPPLFMLPAEFSAAGIRGAILAGAMVSVFIYIIHLLVRIATSSFHLARDARERRQLTLVYLALIKRGAATEVDRQAVFAAIFARADTGLLKHDGGPSFPSLGTAADLLRRSSDRH